MPTEFEGRRVLVTGASRGIGRSLAQKAARAGARVCLAAKSAEQLKTLVSELTASGNEVIATVSDVTVESDRLHLLRTMTDQWGGLDVLINYAELNLNKPFEDSSEDLLRQLMEVNFFAPAELIRSAIPLLTEGRRPAIVNMASTCGRRGLAGRSEYSASKFALCGLTEALRGEMARFDIHVLLVIPNVKDDGPQHCALNDEEPTRIKLDVGMSPDLAADQILNALSKNKSEAILGRSARWMLRANAILPGLIDQFAIRKQRQQVASSSAGKQPKP